MSTSYNALQIENTIDWCINFATDRRGYVFERMFTKFNERNATAITPFKVIQGHILVPIGSSYTRIRLPISD